MECEQNRINTVASTIADLGTERIEAFDEEEPEYDTLTTLANEYDSDAYLALLSIMAGLSDFKLTNTSQIYWQTLEKAAVEHGSLDSIPDVNTIMDVFLDKPVNARFTEMKRNRLVKLNKNGFPAWFIKNYPIEIPGEVWGRTAIDLGGRDKMSTKTVVLAMKVLDIHNLIINGSYLDFPEDIDIPVDVHVKRVALFSGITTPKDAAQIRKCWAKVAGRIEDELEASISLLRVDSIVFQFGQLISEAGFDSDDARRDLIEHAVDVGTPSNKAKRLAQEMTVHLNGEPRVTD